MKIKSEALKAIISILSIICLIISVKLFWDMGIFADEHNVSLGVVSGGDFWLYMDWLRLALIFIICILAGVSISSVRILSITCLIISIKLFWSMGIFSDKYNISLDVVCGGDFWVYMNWLRLGSLFIICILCLINKSHIEE